ncbi:alpha-L-rhamnosidase [Ruficoccus amylovorans]|uniref:Alpha-L-rhamnosidase n=1 Tax=Ruficoccus amylovorans TaxID=1804625 RepID=A0A842HD94_9BACT|nr:alpha-L-rhamnosidase C-terminal domain-containing protein [Ruficoccus amylovorans]MBC2594473.1 alpha-L-rhamnosidase [Ruficoccus amylovorans]
MSRTPSLAESYPAIQDAKWIWPLRMGWDSVNCYALFRKEFNLASLPREALITITADQSYQFYVNGEYVGRGPARGFQRSWPVDEIDIRSWLKKGKNLIAIRAYTPGFSNFQYVNEGFCGLLFAARWGKSLLVSDGSCKCRRQRGVRRDMVPASMQLFPQEAIDLREEDPDWMQPGFDDSGWTDTVGTSSWNAMPWYSLEPRGIPRLSEELIRPGSVIGTANGMNAPDVLTSRNLSITRFEEGLGHQPVQMPLEKIPFKRAPRNGWRSVLIDLGKLHVGSVVLEIEGASGGEIVETHHYETIDESTLCPHYNPDAHCMMAFSHRLTCRQGENRHAFYHPFGYRYMVLTVRGNAGLLSVTPSLRTTVYPLQRKGRFTSSDDTFNTIWEACAWTQQVCSMDAYVDTPWREQAQWWGDARVQSWNTFHLDGDPRLLRRGIRQISMQTTPDGVTYGHAPTMAHGCVLPDFTLIWILTLWDYYWQTGELEPFLAHQDTLQHALEYFRHWTCPKTGLLRYDKRFWLFLDWTGVRREGCSSIYSLWLLHALDRLTQLYTLVGDRKQAAASRKWATTLRADLRKLIARDGLMRDGYDERGKIDSHTSVHAQTLALITGLSPDTEQAMLEKRLLPYLRGKLKTDIQPSAYWITYIFSTLAERGYGADVLEDIRRRWTPMAAHGTTWENFSPVQGEESFSHAWSAHPLFHLMQILGGVRQSGPAWERITCEPVFVGDSAEISIPSPKGDIVSRWARGADGVVRGELVLPHGVKGTLTLPGAKPVPVSGRHTYKLER